MSNAAAAENNASPRSGDRDSIVGQHFIYTYANGWQYELYVKNADTVDYRIHSGMVGGRWVKDQPIDLAVLEPGSFKISWTEPTGTSVVVNIVPSARHLHGTIFFPAWVGEHPERTVLFQNEHLEEMEAHRDAGPTYPLMVVPEGAEITFLEFAGPDNESVISCAPNELPAGYADRSN